MPLFDTLMWYNQGKRKDIIDGRNKNRKIRRQIRSKGFPSWRVVLWPRRSSMGSRPGALTDEEVWINPSRIVLYDREGNSWLCTVNQSEEIYADSGRIVKLGYPNPQSDYYKLFRIQDIIEHGKISLEALNTKYKCYGDEKRGRPIFVRY